MARVGRSERVVRRHDVATRPRPPAQIARGRGAVAGRVPALAAAGAEPELCFARQPPRLLASGSCDRVRHRPRRARPHRRRAERSARGDRCCLPDRRRGRAHRSTAPRPRPTRWRTRPALRAAAARAHGAGCGWPATRAPRGASLVASSRGSTASGSASRAPRGKWDTTPRATARDRSPRVLASKRRPGAAAQLSRHRADPEARRRRPGGDPCQPWRFGRRRGECSASTPRPLDPQRPYFGHNGRTLRIAAVCRDFVPVRERP